MKPDKPSSPDLHLYEQVPLPAHFKNRVLARVTKANEQWTHIFSPKILALGAAFALLLVVSIHSPLKKPPTTAAHSMASLEAYADDLDTESLAELALLD